MAMFRFWQMGKPLMLLAPAADAAGRASGYFSVKNAHKATIGVLLTQGNAATVALTPMQASAVAGTGAKVLSAACPIVSCLDFAASDALVERTAAANYTTDAGVKLKMVFFEIVPAQHMDVANGFDCLGITTGASNAANITAAFLYLSPLRLQQSTPPSAMVD